MNAENQPNQEIDFNNAIITLPESLKEQIIVYLANKSFQVNSLARELIEKSDLNGETVEKLIHYLADQPWKETHVLITAITTTSSYSIPSSQDQ